MKSKKQIVLIIILLIGFMIQDKTKSQDVKVILTKLERVDKKLEISYNFVKFKKSQRFKVWTEINSSVGKLINARALSGDIGENLTGGEGKKIFWDYNADGVVLNEEIKVKVWATVSTVEGAVSVGKVVGQSLILPGWGLSSIDEGKPYWAMGVAGYALMGSSIYFYIYYKSNYDKYSNSYDAKESSTYFDKSQSQKSISKALAVTAIGTWSISMVWTLVKASKRNKSLTNLDWKDNLSFYTGIDPYSKTTVFTIHYHF